MLSVTKLRVNDIGFLSIFQNGDASACNGALMSLAEAAQERSG